MVAPSLCQQITHPPHRINLARIYRLNTSLTLFPGHHHLASQLLNPSLFMWEQLEKKGRFVFVIISLISLSSSFFFSPTYLASLPFFPPVSVYQEIQKVSCQLEFPQLPVFGSLWWKPSQKHSDLPPLQPHNMRKLWLVCVPRGSTRNIVISHHCSPTI